MEIRQKVTSIAKLFSDEIELGHTFFCSKNKMLCHSNLKHFMNMLDRIYCQKNPYNSTPLLTLGLPLSKQIDDLLQIISLSLLNLKMDTSISLSPSMRGGIIAFPYLQ